MNHQEKIDQFIGKVTRRLNRFRFADVMIRATLIGAILLLVLGLTFILRGYAVPKIWFLAGAGAVLAGGVISWIVKRLSHNSAAHFADNFFGLKDSLSTALHFRNEHRNGDFVELQEKTTIEKISSTDPESIRYELPKRLLWTAAALVALCTLMAFKKASPEVVEQIRIEEETAERSAEIKEFVEEMVEELARNATEDEKELLDPDKLKEWVKELEQTKDRKEAMRQYAQLERKLQEAARRLDQRKNEQLLAKAGIELQKDAENRAIGKKMENKNFREAAADLSAMKPAEVAPKNLSEQRKELARLKSASQRMAAAAKAANRQSSSSQNSGSRNQNSNSNSSNSKSSSGKSGEKAEGSNGSGSQSGGDLSSEIASLEKSLSNLDKAMANAEQQEKQQGQCNSDSLSDCQNCRNSVLSDLDKLSKSMCKVSSKSESKAKLLSMCKSMGQCQGFMCQKDGMSLSECMGNKPGGKKAGQGSVESRRDERDFLTDNGNTTQLKGIQGSGPSQSTIESAEEGSGVSSRRTANRQLEFSRQVESFVQREDVPEDVKQGVKNYFENIHQSGE
ncbi:MAG: hypothetical protein P1U89_00950 [Verrucomicrobiales bacterium]|nr:hypothetical protein [Verrucomicrobiales bacterium]